MMYKIILMPIIGFIIGYFTNYIAIKMLFHPRKKVLGFQGVLPRRKKILAAKIGEITPEIMPPYFKKIKSIPIVGEKIMGAFQKSVENQINNLSIDELEKIILKVAKKELMFITWIGGILGFLIGLVQAGILLI